MAEETAVEAQRSAATAPSDPLTLISDVAIREELKVSAMALHR
jgi:hypothetical protein